MLRNKPTTYNWHANPKFRSQFGSPKQKTSCNGKIQAIHSGVLKPLNWNSNIFNEYFYAR